MVPLRLRLLYALCVFKDECTYVCEALDMMDSIKLS